MAKRLPSLNSRRGILVLWAPPPDMCHFARIDTENELRSIVKAHSNKFSILTLYAVRSQIGLVSKDQDQIREQCRFNFESRRGFDLVIIAGGEAPMIMELLIRDASLSGLPIWNYAHPGTVLDDFWHKMYEDGIIATELQK